MAYDVEGRKLIRKMVAKYFEHTLANQSTDAEPIRQTRPKPYHFFAYGSHCKMLYHFPGPRDTK